jgi:hypothetical protein
MSSSVQALQALQTNLVAFFDELIEMFPSEGDFVIYRIMIKDRIPITEVVKMMAEYLLPEKDSVKASVKEAIAGNAAPFNDRINSMFSKFGGGSSEVKSYKLLFDNMDKDSKIAIWKWLNVFIHLIEKCQS